jgi:hypothetical protein
LDDNDIDSFNINTEEFKNQIIKDITEIGDVQVIELVNVEDDTGDFPKGEQKELKTESTPQLPKRDKHYENSDHTTTPEEIAKTEMRIREDTKNELRRFSFDQGLKQETYLINKQFETEILHHPPKNVEEKVFDNKQTKKIIQKFL